MSLYDSEQGCAKGYKPVVSMQVHVQEDGTVHVYSRNLENTTSKYPDIIARMPQAMAPGVKSVVLDGEVQAWDTEKKVFLPFQVLTTRKRKDVAEDQIKVQVLSISPAMTQFPAFAQKRWFSPVENYDRTTPHTTATD